MRTRDLVVLVSGMVLIIGGIILAGPTEDLTRILVGAGFVWAGVGIIIGFGPRSS